MGERERKGGGKSEKVLVVCINLVATISVSRYEMKYTHTHFVLVQLSAQFFQRLFFYRPFIGMEVPKMKLGVCQRLDRDPISV